MNPGGPAKDLGILLQVAPFSSNARRYRLALDPPPREGTSFVQIGSDGGLLVGLVAHEEIDIAQAERFDVIVDFSRYPIGAEVTLVNGLGSGGTARVMRFVVARRGANPKRAARGRLRRDPADLLLAVDPEAASSSAGEQRFQHVDQL